MSEPPPPKRRADAWASDWVTAVLAVSAVVAVGFKLLLALSPEDTDALESPLVLPVARQLIAGPWELYGPFGGWNPLVLIHAPLYYRLAALVAWPLARAGLDPVSAALMAGRSLSFLGLLLTLLAAARLARLDGAPRRVERWAMLLVAAAPVLGGLPVAVRPDMLGVALQTTGVLLVLSSLREERPRAAPLLAAFAAFGLATCIKQPFVVAPAISTGLMLAAWRRGRIAFKPIERGLLLALAIVLIVYGAEELATGGGMSQAVFGAAARVGRVHPASWARLEIVLIAVVDRSVGLLALLAAAGLAAVLARPGLFRRAFAMSGACLLGLVVVLAACQFGGADGSVILAKVIGELFILPLLILACVLIEPRSLLGGRLDAALWVYLAGETLLMAALCRASTGAWINYAIQAAVFASVLTARALARAFDSAPSLRSLLPAALAVLAVPIAVLQDVKGVATQRAIERVALAQVFEQVGRPRREFFFVDLPGHNRVRGRPELVYDDWLYPVFESIGLAEPRSVWLRRALTAGPVRVVVTTSTEPRIAGLEQTLPQLGYRLVSQVGSYLVWRRNAPTSRGG